MRGKLHRPRHCDDGRRITPAHAGKTRGCVECIPHGEDHPRVCGENRSASSASAERAGSPPRVRGKLGGACMKPDGERITPACAGKTLTVVAMALVAEDHPRVCGENAACDNRGARGVGSPPRVRGKRRHGSGTKSPERITPACAGKTHRDLVCLFVAEDHPRVCGENRTPICASAPRGGSPPRVRGKRTRPMRGIERPRITPACAGKTRKSHSSTFRSQDHPRVCGENMM